MCCLIYQEMDFLWGQLKRIVYEMPIESPEEIIALIRAVVADVREMSASSNVHSIHSAAHVLKLVVADLIIYCKVINNNDFLPFIIRFHYSPFLHAGALSRSATYFPTPHCIEIVVCFVKFHHSLK
ncbi:hypothetical protein AVEN_117072-1 [Araneus ventricosus]|uniref:Uncharacterized protein n=1 Tax=Araneus ventricosus TaxID=182803 RepID=A0A4Y2B083_ARAVE|nr:hypothetical protein AVEN_130627-1 [Araneus ventricosus]GBO25508.1 hypothetical protein AVEN_117072-1 [Araneus ventricosus]